MALSELKNTTKNLPQEIESAINSQVEYYKLYGFRILAKSATGLVTIFVMGLFTMSILSFFAIGGAFMIGEWLGSYSLGFLVVGCVLIIAALVVFLFRKRIVERPILKRMSDVYFKED